MIYLLFLTAFASYFTRTDAVFVLEALGEIRRGAEAGVVGYFGDGAVGGFEELAAAGKARLAKQFHGSHA